MTTINQSDINQSDINQSDNGANQPTISQQAKRGRGRPPGPALPPADLLHPHTVRLTSAEWASCLSTGDASGFVRKAIQKALRGQSLS